MARNAVSKQSYNRTKSILIRVTEDELAAIKKAAKIKRRTVSGYIRSQIVSVVALPKI